MGTNSPARTTSLSNTGDAPLAVSDVTVSENYSETNNCGTAVTVGGSCTITVYFEPTTGGAIPGTLSVTDDASGSPHTVALSGKGQDFTLAASPGSPTSQTVAPGQTAKFVLNMGGEGGFNQSVAFTCTGAPPGATCTVPPSPVTPGNSATNVTVTVTAPAASVGRPRSRRIPPVPPLSSGPRGLFILAMGLAAMLWNIVRQNRSGVSRWQSTMVLLISGLLLALGSAGCGSEGGGGGGANPPPHAQTYTLTVTGTAGSGSSALSHSVTLSLTVS